MTERVKKAVIRQDLLEITGGDFVTALILNQMIYWSQRIKDFDKFIEEERKRAKEFGYEVKMDLSHGWIWKTADELVEELMISSGYKRAAVANRLENLVKLGYLDKRKNPHNKMDRTLQYRVNICKIQLDLLEKGWALEDYKIDLDFITEVAKRLKKPEQPRKIRLLRNSSRVLLGSNGESPNSNALSGESNGTPPENNGTLSSSKQYQKLDLEISSDTTSDTPTTNTPVVAVGDESIVTDTLVVKTIVGDDISDKTIRTWLKFGTPKEIINAYNVATQNEGVDDIGAYVTYLLKEHKEAMTSFLRTRLTPTKSERAPVKSHDEKMQDGKYADFYAMYKTETHQDEFLDEAAADKESDSTLRDAVDVWAEILISLKESLPQASYQTFFENSTAISYDDHVLTVKMPASFFVAGHSLPKLADHLRSAAIHVEGKVITFKWE